MNPKNKTEDEKIEESKKLLCPKAGTATSSPILYNNITLRIVYWKK